MEAGRHDPKSHYAVQTFDGMNWRWLEHGRTRSLQTLVDIITADLPPADGERIQKSCCFHLVA